MQINIFITNHYRKLTQQSALSGKHIDKFFVRNLNETIPIVFGTTILPDIKVQ